MDEDSKPRIFPETLQSLQNKVSLPAFISDLARVEWALYQAAKGEVLFDEKIESLSVNPTLTLVPVTWKNLVGLITDEADESALVQEPTPVHIIIWRHPKTNKLQIREAEDADLLALKIAVEKIEPKKAAAIAKVSIDAVESRLYRAVSQGILIAPDPLIRREVLPKAELAPTLEAFLAADIFTLQWHITQACDLHCKHCYDRSDRAPLPYEKAIEILDDFYSFCREMRVRGQVSFTGGNPLLYPQFMDVYKEASERGFGIAILGNPSPIDTIEALLPITKPLYFQVSLEGLEAHNDTIRGKGHFKRTLIFLEQLRNLGIYTMVMLTLTRDNIDQVLPLADLLRERTDFFTFNRLSTVGEGARLSMATPDAFQTFLGKYEAAADQNPILGLKDNLINIIRSENGRALFGGCTGYGCGAAFNFVALLPDGEVHACRKFPSPIGNMLQKRLTAIYHSPQARRYRDGSQACRECKLNIVCRGCLASTYSHDLDVFEDKDPFCFMEQKIS